MNAQKQSRTLYSMILAQRIIISLAFIFLATGETLHLNAFIQNAIDIGLPYAKIFCTLAVILAFISAAGVLTGFLFRTSSTVAAVITLFSSFFFFAGDFNKVNVVGSLFALALLTGFIIIGPGQFSLDYYLKKKKEKENKRILFR